MDFLHNMTVFDRHWAFLQAWWTTLELVHQTRYFKA